MSFRVPQLYHMTGPAAHELRVEIEQHNHIVSHGTRPASELYRAAADLESRAGELIAAARHDIPSNRHARRLAMADNAIRRMERAEDLERRADELEQAETGGQR